MPDTLSGAGADRLDAFPCLGPAATPTAHGQEGNRSDGTGDVQGCASHRPALRGEAQTSPSLLVCCTVPRRAALLYLSFTTAGGGKGRGVHGAVTSLDRRNGQP